MRSAALATGLCGLCGLCACGDNLPGEDRQGGDATVDDRSAEAFAHPLPTLDAAQAERHRFGRGPVAFMWAPPQLGPLFNHSACLACHPGNGRGASQIAPGMGGSQALIRVSLGAGTPDVPGGVVPVPGFGTQLQDHAVDQLPEIRARLTWVESPEYYGDGEVAMLRAPRVDVTLPGGEPLPIAMQMSYRQAPPLIGLGLLEAVPEAALHALADPDDADGDGISGRVNLVWDTAAQATRAGRFGHKASVATVREQTAGAFAADMGLSNAMFPDADGNRDVSDLQLGDSAFFITTIAVPRAAPRTEAAWRGRDLFDDLGCAGCHTPALVTGAHELPQLAGQTIHPYTDLLLHDVGDLLTDARSDFLATGIEWRTPPLWGLGLAQLVNPDATFLHDGRARTIAEAILWHGGEAQPSREAFRHAPRRDRDALIAFLETL
ncbi:MAG TPA: di-heme oxidoredictase family protein [Kofleriaceae bacterium]|nr:di-heme oxidoredictase family protein [Kofleriaceae bacterium]